MAWAAVAATILVAVLFVVSINGVTFEEWNAIGSVLAGCLIVAPVIAFVWFILATRKPADENGRRKMRLASGCGVSLATLFSFLLIIGVFAYAFPQYHGERETRDAEWTATVLDSLRGDWVTQTSPYVFLTINDDTMNIFVPGNGAAPDVSIVDQYDVVAISRSCIEARTRGAERVSRAGMERPRNTPGPDQERRLCWDAEGFTLYVNGDDGTRYRRDR
jgi:amino acid transporter